jgi:hypothetical protein
MIAWLAVLVAVAAWIALTCIIAFWLWGMLGAAKKEPAGPVECRCRKGAWQPDCPVHGRQVA